MSDQRETKLWKEIGWLRFLLAIAITIILGIAYFSIWKWNISIWRDLFLNITANLIPVPLVFILVYIAFRRIEELRSDRNADELADKVVQRLIDIANTQSTVSGENNNFLGDPFQFSELHMKLSREFDVAVNPFDTKSSPQKLSIKCTYRGDNIIHIKKISYSGRKLSIEDLGDTYKRTNNGMNALIQQGNEEISPGEHYVFDLILAKKWHKSTIESWFGNLGYLHFEIEHGQELENLQKPI